MRPGFFKICPRLEKRTVGASRCCRLFLLALSALLAGCLPADDSGVKQELGNFIKVGHLAALDIVQEGPSGPIVFDVSGNEAYIAIAKCSPDEEDGLRWLCDECWWREIDLSDPTMPKEAGLDVVPFAVEVLDIYEDHAYIVSSWPNRRRHRLPGKWRHIPCHFSGKPTT
ncbi:MAG: hypothetical protein P8129_07890 [Anaerolineae bacterium]